MEPDKLYEDITQVMATSVTMKLKLAPLKKGEHGTDVDIAIDAGKELYNKC